MGFGRIGRNVFRLLHKRDDLDVVAVSDIADPEALTYLLKYDSLYGRFPGEVSYADGILSYDNKQVTFSSAREPGDTEWGSAGVEIVLETTSRYRSRDVLQRHLASGAKKVVLTSSPETPGEIPLLLRGVNDEILSAEIDIVALGSNTSNAIAPPTAPAATWSTWPPPPAAPAPTAADPLDIPPPQGLHICLPPKREAVLCKQVCRSPVAQLVERVAVNH